ncbi:RidA family protein [Actinoalloteichus hymeniacidonis]|uniref:Translation initiation inhibitor, yjgF family n=1 Tax=Actinoalloteichus hymeniacidonis TaxID=340345 RepID=A0AAC9HMK2_9PSEU|nr:RidA family protein [Actinoalloteichus hymeniacidonis]AOS61893.1 putative translation initiation inhibitor, yjgF family [Actinoalloteichus hymeniacidonis]MBB5910087.1 enamine deaminase RidA (YjgF/YER057c/UK114 family) [Actinoalloteichus hymeniacidonis]
MAHTIVNPAGLHNPVPRGYSHTAAISADTGLVLIAGQYGSTPDGEIVSSDFTEQVEQTFRNIGVALAAHGLDLGHVVQLRTYVVNHDVGKLGPIAAAVRKNWGENPPTQTLIGVAGLATPDVLFEVEALAARP